ncbi:MAG TPA: succinyl-diaminopimelate desuccinylase [Devosiaceae bacterium]|jgi:succinyl-diaminopimelate desuccinylase|nr:succinyl-diaminopimelate desuccinylase [Devosiaceae bacterium]
MPEFNKGDPLPLLRDLIRCPSVTPEEAGALDVLEAALVPLGFAVSRVRFEGDGSYPVDNLFATRGSGRPHLLFAGHTDVVPPGDERAWRHPPFAAEIEDGVIYGRGAADMKSGVAAFVAAAATENALGTISLAITNDEEADSINGTDKLMAWAAAEGHVFDFAIVGEPSSAVRLGDSIKIGRRGSLSGRIVVSGRQGHVAYPDRASNPLPAMATVVAELSGALDGGTECFQPSNLEFTTVDTGNPTSNVIPAQAEARFNVRFNDSWTPGSLEEHLRARLAALPLGECRATLETLGRASRAFLSPQGEAVETLCRTIEAETGEQPDLSTAGGTSDARFIAPYCPVVECGLPGQSMHQTDEHVAVSDVHGLSRIYAAFIRDYLGAETRR